jgi:hypothetical protein
MKLLNANRNLNGLIQVEVRHAFFTCNVGISDAAARELIDDLQRCLAGEADPPAEGPNVIRMKKKNG